MIDARLRSMMVFTMFVVLLAGCYDVSEYTGDGKLVDNGARSATDRYILNLGLIDLRKQQKYTYRISGLPEENFIAGIELTLEDPDLVGDRIIRPVIALRLSGHTEEVIFATEARLDKWTWSTQLNSPTAFAYQRGEPGTYFDASSNTEYTVTLTVLEADLSRSEYSAILLLKSGGWK